MILESQDYEPPIYRFAGEHRWLSNFWPATVVLDGSFYPSVEHAYQAAKTLNPGIRTAISMAVRPGAAKRLGRGLDIRHGWNGMRLRIMEDLVRQKFTRDSELMWRLLATGNRPLFEGNTHGDRFWGVVVDEPGIMVGDNHLGKIIMKVREELRCSEK